MFGQFPLEWRSQMQLNEVENVCLVFKLRQDDPYQKCCRGNSMLDKD